MRGMKAPSGERERQMLAVSVLFAAAGFFAFVVAYFQPTMPDSRVRSINEFITADAEKELERRERILNEVSALDKSGADIPEDIKLKMLQALQETSETE